MSTFQLERAVWTDPDFDAMGWHDCHVHSIAFRPDTWAFLIDLDYIFQWVDPQPPDERFRFWLAPATMVFKNAHTVKVDTVSASGKLEIVELTRGESRDTPNGKMKERQYRIECQEGVLELWATGFEMIVRKAPCIQSIQSLDHDERGGISFDRAPCTT